MLIISALKMTKVNNASFYNKRNEPYGLIKIIISYIISNQNIKKVIIIKLKRQQNLIQFIYSYQSTNRIFTDTPN